MMAFDWANCLFRPHMLQAMTHHPTASISGQTDRRSLVKAEVSDIALQVLRWILGRLVATVIGVSARLRDERRVARSHDRWLKQMKSTGETSRVHSRSGDPDS